MSWWNKRKPYEVGDREGKRVIIEVIRGSGEITKSLIVQCDCGSPVHTIKAHSFSASPACRICGGRLGKRKYGPGPIAAQNRLYRIWVGMRARCQPNGKGRDWLRWGARGIRVCQEWNEDFKAFETWSLGNGYKDGLTLDRVNNDGNYDPLNCEWVTKGENSRRVHKVYSFFRRAPADGMLNGILGFGA